MHHCTMVSGLLFISIECVTLWLRGLLNFEFWPKTGILFSPRYLSEAKYLSVVARPFIKIHNSMQVFDLWPCDL